MWLAGLCLSSIALADGVVRCVPGEDHTNGFFVSCFIKKGSSTEMTNQKRKRTMDNEADMNEGEEEDENGAPDASLEPGLSAVISNKQKKKNKRKKKKNH